MKGQDFPFEEIVRQIMQETNDENKKMKRVNIILCGKSGVGKSTLINAVFREPLAETGIGKPVTQHVELLENDDLPLRVYDTKGLELGDKKSQEMYDEITDIIRRSLHTQNEDEYIHAIWYCINSMSNRVEDEELNFIRQLSRQPVTNVPVIVVLTQSLSKEQTTAMQNAIQAELPQIYVMPVLALDFRIDDSKVIEAHGLYELTACTYNLLPESARRAFNNAQCANLEIKRKAAQKHITAAITGVFGIGFAPVPFADAPAMIAAQVAMLAKITSIYGLKVTKGTLLTIASSLIGSGGATILGRQISGSILKLIPGVGTAAGGAISGATGALLTAALGATYCKILEMVLRGEIKQESFEDKEGRKKIIAIFKDELKLRRKKTKHKKDNEIAVEDLVGTSE